MTNNNDLYTKANVADTIISSTSEIHILQKLLIKSKKYWQDELKGHNRDDFNWWLKNEYGVQITYNNEFKYINGYDVVDEKKFTIFMLKFS